MILTVFDVSLLHLSENKINFGESFFVLYILFEFDLSEFDSYLCFFL